MLEAKFIDDPLVKDLNDRSLLSIILFFLYRSRLFQPHNDERNTWSLSVDVTS